MKRSAKPLAAPLLTAVVVLAIATVNTVLQSRSTTQSHASFKADMESFRTSSMEQLTATVKQSADSAAEVAARGGNVVSHGPQHRPWPPPHRATTGKPSERPQGRAAPSPAPVGAKETWGGPAFP